MKPNIIPISKIIATIALIFKLGINCEGTAYYAYQRLSATRSSPETHFYTPSLAERDANINRVSFIVMTGLFYSYDRIVYAS